MKTFLVVIVLLGVGLSISGCERNDYQHPMHRNGSK